jgi:tetratricopeptide (TPR) repeat protein
MRSSITPKTIRRLIAADGYMALNMNERAVSELEKAEDSGPLEGPRQLLLGLARKRLGEQEDAIPHLEQAARLMPAPVRSFAWSELASCYRRSGNEELADLAESLGGEKSYELRIALAGSELHICSTDAAAEII